VIFKRLAAVEAAPKYQPKRLLQQAVCYSEAGSGVLLTRTPFFVMAKLQIVQGAYTFQCFQGGRKF